MMWIVVFASVAFLHLIHSAPTESTTTTSSIADHLQEIISVIPKDLIKNITHEHLKSDEGFKAAVQFMQSDEWIKRVKIIREKPEWVALKQYMKGYGINMDKFIKCTEGFLQNVTVKLDPKHPAHKKSVKAFLLDVEKNLPTAKILSAIHEKMIKNEELQKIFEKLSSTETRKMVDKVLALPEIKSMLKDLAEMDLNLEDLLSLMYALLGWGELKLH